MTYGAEQIRRFNRRGTTRIFWADAAIGTKTLANIQAEDELTNNIQGIGGFEPDVRVATIRNVGSYVASSDYGEGVLRFYDLTGGDTPVRGLFVEGTAKYGFLYFIRDAVAGAGATGSRLSEFKVSTVGGQDDYTSNIAMWSVTFAITAANTAMTVVA